jgi:2-polyprenyl-6-methoxyphenol hydroxylase-like FAD-dependent oxidoreductase
MADQRAVDRRDARICIVGAGAAGLSAARALRRLGYRRITVLERERRVGGKCYTIQHEGRAYELGAGALTRAYRNVRALMAETGVRCSAMYTQAFVDLDERRARWLPLDLSGGGLWSLGVQATRFARELWRNRRIWQPGFEGVSAELCRPFDAWCQARGVERIGEMIKPWATGFGYGFFDEVPTAYLLKYTTLFVPPLLEILEHGYGGLWERVARGIEGADIRLGTSIVRIEREEGAVRVHTAEGATLEFDALVIACPLDETLRFMDVTPVEVELFSRIRYYDYWVVGAVVEGLPRATCLFVPRHFEREYVGAPMFVYQRWPGSSGLTCFYGFARRREGYEADARDAVCAMVERLGGTVRSMPVTMFWRYFPHVSPEDMAAGFYSRLEALQGQRATYYCGELLGFTTVETTVDYARAMVARYFSSYAATAVRRDSPQADARGAQTSGTDEVMQTASFE